MHVVLISANDYGVHHGKPWLRWGKTCVIDYEAYTFVPDWYIISPWLQLKSADWFKVKYAKF